MKIISMLQHDINVIYHADEAKEMIEKHDGWSHYADKDGKEYKNFVVIPGQKKEDSTRLDHIYESSTDICGIQIENLVATNVINNPPVVDGVIYIVPYMVSRFLRGRKDIYCASVQKHNKDGSVKFTEGLVRIEH